MPRHRRNTANSKIYGPCYYPRWRETAFLACHAISPSNRRGVAGLMRCDAPPSSVCPRLVFRCYLRQEAQKQQPTPTDDSISLRCVATSSSPFRVWVWPRPRGKGARRFLLFLGDSSGRGYGGGVIGLCVARRCFRFVGTHSFL